MKSSEEHLAKASRRRFEPADLAIWVVGIFLAVILRLSLFDFESEDYSIYLGPWYDFIVSNGGFDALEYEFSNYSSLYLYLLTSATYLPLPKLYAIKLVSISFDFLLAFFVLLIVRLKYENRTVWAFSFFTTLFAPTVVINSALWGQSDATYTSMLVASIYFAIRRRPNLSLFFFSVALSFKLQAVFLFPLFIVLLLKRRVPTYSFLIIPATYVLSILPAWLAGRPLMGLLMTYLAQAGLYPDLTLNAPNLYQWLPNDPGLFGRPGIILAVSLVCLLCLVTYRSGVRLDGDVIVKLSLVSVLLLPFTLPHMHERYFFAADVVSIIYAFYSPKRFFVPIIVGAASLFSYFPFLFGEERIGLQYLAVLTGVALIVATTDLIKSLYPNLAKQSHPAPGNRGARIRPRLVDLLGERTSIEGPIAGASKAVGRAWGFVLLVFVASRLFYLLAGALLASIIPVNPLYGRVSIFASALDTLNIWANFDGEHYVIVSEGGYSQDSMENSPVYFPLYPLLIRLSATLFGGPISPEALSAYGVLISLIAFCFALYFVYRVAEEGWGVRAAEGTVLALAFFPTSFFFNAVFTESLFLAFSAGAVWAVRVRKNLLLACVLAGLATATRNVGVLLLIPLVVEWSDRQEYGWRRGMTYLALAPSGLVAYMAYLWWRFDNPLLFYSAQAAWGRGPSELSTLWSAFSLAYEDALALFYPANYDPFSLERLVYVVSSTNDLYNLVFLLFAFTILFAGWRLLPAGLSVYALAVLAASVLFAPVASPLQSTPRYVLAAFPLFIVLGATVLQDRKVLLGWLLVSAAVSLVFTALFVGWYFVA